VAELGTATADTGLAERSDVVSLSLRKETLDGKFFELP
jgi:hypothetical protein